MITITDLSKTYHGSRGKVHALAGVTTTILDGTTALIGPNGSGKSTLMKILATIEKPSSGQFTVDGKNIDARSRNAYLQSIGYVPQDVRFVSSMRCEDALEYAGWVAGMRNSEVRPRIPEVLEQIQLPDIAKKKVGALSGGQNRRLGIAAALLHRPTLLLLDEPTAGLDPQARIEIRSIVRELGAETTTIVSTHLADDVEAIAENVIALHHGELAFAGTWHDLLAKTSNTEKLSSDALENALSYIMRSAPDASA